MKKIIYIVLFLFIIGGGITFATWVGTNNIIPAHHASKTRATFSYQDTTIRPGMPRTLDIPTLKVHAFIESVGMDRQGRMDIPKDSRNAAWYNLGYKPGENGSAVIDGHLDLVSGAPAIFYNLKTLQAGDQILVTDDQDHIFTFKVTKVANYPYNQFPLQEVFGQEGKPMLNVITCEGTWNKNSKNYSHRTVVYSEMIQ